MKDQDPGPRIASAEFVAGAPDVAKLPETGVLEIAFAGRSNVGKSSLMNTLLARRGLVRTSSTPGCTRQINVFETSLVKGPTLHLVDLPGYGYAKLSKKERQTWGRMIESYLSGRPTLRGVVLLLDVRRGLEEDDTMLVDFLDSLRRPEVKVWLLATKCDKLSKAERKPALDLLRKRAKRTVIGFSSVSGEGRGVLWDAILGAL